MDLRFLNHIDAHFTPRVKQYFQRPTLPFADSAGTRRKNRPHPVVRAASKE
jgi:hypothetical protein